jgi:hypothetical protein
MNNPSRDINVLLTCFSLMALAYLIFWRLRILAVDWYRDQMFQLRDSLFDAATDGVIDFDHPAYGTLRSTMNGYIRFCHRLSLLQVLLLATSLPRPTEGKGLFNRNWQLVTQNLDPKALKSLEGYREQMSLLMVSYLILSSPFISILLFVFVLLAFALSSLGNVKTILDKWAKVIRRSRRFQPILSDIDDSAYANGVAI